MYQHFSGNGPKPEPRSTARHCSECGNELYADEEFKCNECQFEEDMDVVNEDHLDQE